MDFSKLGILLLPLIAISSCSNFLSQIHLNIDLFNESHGVGLRDVGVLVGWQEECVV